MGQKVNLNNFLLKRKNTINFFNSIDSNKNYSLILKEVMFLQFLFKNFFEQSDFYVKECFIVFSAIKFKIYIYISFLSDLQKINKTFSNKTKIKCVSFFNYFLNKYNFNAYTKVYIFKNLNLNVKKFNSDFYFLKIFKNYEKESYFFFGKKIVYLLQKTQNGDILFIHFLSKFLIFYHRNKKTLNKFMHFLNLLLLFLYKFKIVSGIRIQLKGRLRGTPRSKKYKFQQGQIPAQTISTSIKYQYKQIYTRYGTVGLKVWLHQ